MNEDTRQSMTPVAYAVHVPQETTTLLDIWRSIVAKRLLVSSIAGGITLLGVVYALLAPVQYRAETFLLPPLREHLIVRDINGAALHDIDLDDLELSPIEVDEVYAEFQKNLRSRRVRRLFFDQNNLGDLYSEVAQRESANPNAAFEKFNESLIFRSSSGSTGDFSRVSFDLDDPERAATILNDFVDLVQAETTASLYAVIQGEISSRISHLKVLIERKRQLSNRLRMDRIEQLEEALAVATEMNLEDPVSVSEDISVVVDNRGENNFAMARSPLYLRGTKSLSAEMNALKNRENPDAFIARLREIQSELDYLQSIEIDYSNLRAATIDQHALPPARKFKPRRTLIVGSSAALGTFVAVLVVILIGAVQQPKSNRYQ